MKLFEQNGIQHGTLQTSTATMTNGCVMEMQEDEGAVDRGAGNFQKGQRDGGCITWVEGRYGKTANWGA